MVDPIASSVTAGAITGDGAVTRVAAATPVAPTPAVVSTRPDLAQTSGVAQAMAATPPVDADRVATIKKAIAEGRFPILPATIADRLIALKLQWHPNDPGNDQA